MAVKSTFQAMKFLKTPIQLKLHSFVDYGVPFKKIIADIIIDPHRTVLSDTLPPMIL